MNWHEAIRTGLGSITGDPSLDLDVVDELAGHLADSYAAARASGLDHDRAAELALEELKDSDRLERALRVAPTAGRPRPHRPVRRRASSPARSAMRCACSPPRRVSPSPPS